MDTGTKTLHATIQEERLQMHRAKLLNAVGSSAFAGFLCTLVFAPILLPIHLTAWIAGLLLALALRIFASRRYDLALSAGLNPDVWLKRFRLTYILHGIAWSALLFFVLSASTRQFEFAAFILVVVSAGSMFSTVFDVAASLSFVAPILVSLMVNLAARSEPDHAPFAAALATFLVVTYLSALRAQKIVLESIRLRMLESASAQAARLNADVAVKKTQETHQKSLQLAESEEYLARTLNATGDAIFATDGADMSHPVRFHNDRMLELWDIKLPKGVLLTSDHIIAAASLQFEDPDLELQRIHHIIGAGKIDESRIKLRDGRTILRRHIPALVGEKKIRVWSFRDVTSDEELRVAAVAFEGTEAITITDARGIILRVNTAFCKCFGYTNDELIGQRISILKSGRHSTNFYKLMWDSIRDTDAWHGEVWDKRKDGEIIPMWLTISTVKNDVGEVTNYVATHVDLSENKRFEQRIHELAHFDPLTRLPNLRLLKDRLQQAITASARNEAAGAVISVGIDQYNKLNASLGLEQCDELIQVVAERLSASVREGDTVAHKGADQFVVVLQGLDANMLDAGGQAEDVARKIIANLSNDYELNEQIYRCTSSVGIAMFHGADCSPQDLLEHSGLAMHQPKDVVGHSMRFFDPAMQAAIVKLAALESELRRAIEDHQLVLHFQPQLTGDKKLTGAEVLVRWQHPQRGLVLPLEFIPVAEDSGLIIPLGMWVLETACKQLVKWSADALMMDLELAVNVSAKQIHQHDFVDKVVDVLQSTGVNPHRLKLELTESLLISNIEATIGKMQRLSVLGVSFSLDDFGTGYSSLSYLTRLPLTQLKIDRSFVMDIESSEDSVAICSATIGLAHNLKLKVVAEGVESEAQHYFLSTVHRCDLIQGYLFSKPLPLHDFEAFCR